MANVLFLKCVADDTYLTPKAKYDSLAPHAEGTFYLVGSELYLGDVLLSATTAAEIGIEDLEGVLTATDVEAALNELFHAQNDKTLWVHDDSAGQSDYAKVYKFYQGENDYVADRTDGKTNPILKGTINIPKDKVVEDGEVVDIFFDDTDDTLHEGSASGPDVTEYIIGTATGATEADAGKYIKLILQNVANPLYIAAKDLVDIYTGSTNDEMTVTVTENVISAAVNKIAATKVVYAAESYEELTSGATFDDTETYYVLDGTDYVVDATVTAANFADKVAAGLYIKHNEVTIKGKVDQVEADLTALDNYVGDIPSGLPSEVDTVVEYIDYKTGSGVDSLNGEAGIASKNSSTNVITLKGGIVETKGVIDNSVATAPATSVDVYINPSDGKFYTDNTYTTEVTPVVDTAYVDQNGGGTFVWTTEEYALVRPDVELAAVAATGAAADVSYDNTTSGLTADDVQEAIDEINGVLTWNNV